MNTTPSSSSSSSPPSHFLRERALVLGGGGSAGNAWLIGVLAGLADAGLDATSSELIVGTSAGATAAAQITGADSRELLDGILHSVPPQRSGPRAGGGPGPDPLERTQRIIDASTDLPDMRRRMGAAAIELDDDSQGAVSARWRATVAPRLPDPSWPEQLIRLTAIDARSGEPVVFDRDSGVELVDAVAASTSGLVAYRIGERRLLDGGYRTNADNADLAAGSARVLVLSPLGGRTRLPLAWRADLATQLERLRADGSRVETILPDAASLAAFGASMMDPSTRPPAARAGYAQGRAAADGLREFWR